MRRAGTVGPDRWQRETPRDHDPEPEAEPESVARAICLRLLTARARTRAELATALRRRQVPDQAADAVLDRFAEVGLIDDESFATSWVARRHAGRGLAGRALAGELRARGVAAETVAQAVGGLDRDTELTTARQLVRRRLPALRSADRQVRFRRLAAMLARRGYSSELALRAVRAELADADPEETPVGPADEPSAIAWAQPVRPGPADLDHPEPAP